MTNEESVNYFYKIWNEKKIGLLGGMFSDDGLYHDPTTRMSVGSYDVDSIMNSLSEVFPDYLFEVLNIVSEGSKLVVEWLLKGTNTEPFKPGFAPTEKKINLQGVDIFDFNERGKLQSVIRHYDQKSLAEQIGLQVIVEPISQGNATYGYSKRVSTGNPNPPAVVGLTWISFRDQSELDHIRVHSGGIIQDFESEEGFISIVTGAAGNRAFTVTAWESEEAMHRALAKHHAKAKQDFRTSDIAPSVWTSVWKPVRIGRNWSRCESCKQPNDMTLNPDTCMNCGIKLQARQSYW